MGLLVQALVCRSCLVTLHPLSPLLSVANQDRFMSSIDPVS